MAHQAAADRVLAATHKAQIRVLNHLNEHGNYVAPDPFDCGRMVLVSGGRQPSQVRGAVPTGVIHDLQSRGALSAAARSSDRLVLNEAGKALLRRRLSEGGQADPFQAQHQYLRAELAGEEIGAAPVVNDAESPLAWLRRRRNRDGSPMLDEVRFMAGERLRADMTRAQMLPRVTSNWTSAVATSARGAGGVDPTDSMVAARQRVRRALAAVGPDLAGILIDVCGFLKGLSDVEKERHWPARSGKVVLDIALGRLVAFYGLAHEAVGMGPANHSVVSWSAPDARPTGTTLHATDAAS